MITVECAVEAGAWPEEQSLQALAKRAIKAAAGESLEGVSGEVSLLFTDDERIRVLNRNWRGKDKATNVLSFPSPTPAVEGLEQPPLGDIIIAYETVLREAEAETKAFDHHLAHLIVHGFLHLLGYDHETEEEAEEMEALERRILKTLAIDDPYA